MTHIRAFKLNPLTKLHLSNVTHPNIIRIVTKQHKKIFCCTCFLYILFSRKRILLSTFIKKKLIFFAWMDDHIAKKEIVYAILSKKKFIFNRKFSFSVLCSKCTFLRLLYNLTIIRKSAQKKQTRAGRLKYKKKRKRGE